MEKSTIIKNVENYIAAFDNKNLDAVAVLLADNFVLEDPVVKRVEGKENALRAIQAIFSGCNQLQFKSRNIFVDGQTTLIEFSLDLDNMHLEGVDIIEWHDGKIAELRAYLDIPKG